MKMNSFNTKMLLSAVGVVALLSSPAFAKTARQATTDSQLSSSQTIPGYDADGATVAIPNPDQR
jgi:hypothetical protein